MKHGAEFADRNRLFSPFLTSVGTFSNWDSIPFNSLFTRMHVNFPWSLFKSQNSIHSLSSFSCWCSWQRWLWWFLDMFTEQRWESQIHCHVVFSFSCLMFNFKSGRSHPTSRAGKSSNHKCIYNLSVLYQVDVSSSTSPKKTLGYYVYCKWQNAVICKLFATLNVQMKIQRQYVMFRGTHYCFYCICSFWFGAWTMFKKLGRGPVRHSVMLNFFGPWVVLKSTLTFLCHF